jgi:hypothetical protein
MVVTDEWRARIHGQIARSGRFVVVTAGLVTVAACGPALITPAPSNQTPLTARGTDPTRTTTAPSGAISPGNHRSLGEAAVPFARYLIAAHERIHPAFTAALAEIASHLPEAKVGSPDLVTTLEIVVDHETGRLVRLGVIRASGLTAFDVATLSAVSHAQPFGTAPQAIASPDGNVYVHWEFHRDPTDGCSLWNAFPYLLNAAAAPAAGSPP